MTIGDVLATVTFLAAAGASWWAVLVGSALIYGARTEQAREALEARPWRTLGSGVLVLLAGGALAAGLASLPNGALKLLGWLVVGGLLALAALGGGGLALALSERLHQLAPNLSPLSRLCRASGLLVGAQFVPLFGWFLLAPLTLTLALGLGFTSLRRPRATTSASAFEPCATQPSAQPASALIASLAPIEVQR